MEGGWEVGMMENGEGGVKRRPVKRTEYVQKRDLVPDSSQE